MQPIPGVFAYLSEGGPKLAESFTAGMSAGSKVKGNKDSAEQHKQDRADKQAKFDYDKAQNERQWQFQQDQVNRQNQLHTDGLTQAYGPDLKYDASGGIDIMSSEAAKRQRASEAEVAAAMGELDGLGMGGAIDDSIRQNPKFMVGAAKGGGRKLMQDELGMRQQAAFDQQTLMQDERANLELEKFMEEQAQMATMSENKSKPEPVNGVWGVYRPDGRFIPLSADAAAQARKNAAKEAASKTNSAPGSRIRVTRGPNNETVITRP